MVCLWDPFGVEEAMPAAPKVMLTEVVESEEEWILLLGVVEPYRGTAAQMDELLRAVLMFVVVKPHSLAERGFLLVMVPVVGAIYPLVVSPSKKR